MIYRNRNQSVRFFFQTYSKNEVFFNTNFNNNENKFPSAAYSCRNYVAI